MVSHEDVETQSKYTVWPSGTTISVAITNVGHPTRDLCFDAGD